MPKIELQKSAPETGSLLPFETKGARATLVEMDRIEAIFAPDLSDKRTAKAFHKALKAAKLTWPERGTAATTPYGAIVFSGLDQAFHFGKKLPQLSGVDVIDISGGWHVLRLEGKDRFEIMARIVPVDLRDAAMPVGSALRTQFGHFQALILKLDEGFDIAIMSSFAKSAAGHLVHEMKKYDAEAKAKNL